MAVRPPHFLLYSDADGDRSPGGDGTSAAGRWRFVLESADGKDRFEADDVEPDVSRERLELLALVRGLEAIDQPAHVTVVTQSRYVRQGLAHGLDEWRDNGWKWERFGELTPVKNGDLWQRVDRALQFHRVECRLWRVDAPHHAGEGRSTAEPPNWRSRLRGLLSGNRLRGGPRVAAAV